MKHPLHTILALVAGLLVAPAAASAHDPVTWVAPAMLPHPWGNLNQNSATYEIALGDFDGDGDVDLATTLDPAVINVGSLYRNDGRGLRFRRDWTGPGGERGMGIVDLDGNGLLDVVLKQDDDEVVVAFSRENSPHIHEMLDGVPMQAAPVTLVDVNGDGALDASLNDLDRHVLLAGDDQDPVAVRLTETQANQHRAVFCDLDEDNDTDGLVVHDGQPIGLFNDGSLPWRAEVTGPAWADVHAVAVGQLIGDARCDIVTSDDNGIVMGWGRWSGGGDFSRIAVNNSEPFYDVQVFDFDGDGDLDVAGTMRHFEDSVQLLESTGGGPQSFIHTQRHLGSDQRTVGAGDGRIHVADLNGDGFMDIITVVDGRVVFVPLVKGHMAVSPTVTRPGPPVAGDDVLDVAALDIEALLPDDITLQSVTVALTDTGGVALQNGVVERVEVYQEASGDQARGPGDRLISSFDGVPPGGQLDLDVQDVVVGQGQSQRLYVVVTLGGLAHNLADELLVDVVGVRGIFDDFDFADGAMAPGRVEAWRLPNAAPSAGPDALTLDEGATSFVNVLGNDSDPDGDALTAVVVQPPSFGQANEEANGDLSYTHDGSESFADSFTYEVRDPGGLASAVVEVTITIDPVNDPPAGQPESYATDEDAPLVIARDQGVLLNDSDPDSPITAVRTQNATNGDVQLAADGSFVYTPEPGYSGPDSFRYTPYDGQVAGPEQIVDITVRARQDPPVGASQQLQMDEDQRLPIQLAGSAPEGDPLVFLIESVPAAGFLLDTNMDEGQLEFVPELNFSGDVSFDYRVSDGVRQSPRYTISITVIALDDDDDGDGTAEDQDNCPGMPNDQADLDGDGLGDACDPDADGDMVDAGEDCDDLAPGVSAPRTFYIDGDGDGRGVAGFDVVGCFEEAPDGYAAELGDNCPLVYNAGQWNNDGDALGNACDACRDQAAQTPDGCPEEPNAQRVAELPGPRTVLLAAPGLGLPTLSGGAGGAPRPTAPGPVAYEPAAPADTVEPPAAADTVESPGDPPQAPEGSAARDGGCSTTGHASPTLLLSLLLLGLRRRERPGD